MFATDLGPGPSGFPGHGADAPLDVPGIERPEITAALAQKVYDHSFDAFSDALAATHNCTRQVRLAGSSVTVDTATGEVLSSFDAGALPFGVLRRPCGNRRANVCPACSRRYARDTFALVHAGVAGGKTVPEQVRDNPLLFVTLTAPSFGYVHGHRDGRACRARVPTPAQA